MRFFQAARAGGLGARGVRGLSAVNSRRGVRSRLAHMDLEQAIRARRSVRDYASEPVPRDTLRALIDAAVQAPSAMNTQAWAFSVVEDQKLLTRVSDAVKAHMLEHLPAAEAPPVRAMLSNPEFHIFYHAPALVVISSTRRGPWETENCALAAQNLMLAACAAGLGTCWIGFAQAWLATDEGRAMLQLPATHRPVAPIIVGRPKAQSAPVARRAPEIRWIGN
jgi:nitroreductase